MVYTQFLLIFLLCWILIASIFVNTEAKKHTTKHKKSNGNFRHAIRLNAIHPKQVNTKHKLNSRHLKSYNRPKPPTKKAKKTNAQTINAPQVAANIQPKPATMLNLFTAPNALPNQGLINLNNQPAYKWPFILTNILQQEALKMPSINNKPQPPPQLFPQPQPKVSIVNNKPTTSNNNGNNNYKPATANNNNAYKPPTGNNNGNNGGQNSNPNQNTGPQTSPNTNTQTSTNTGPQTSPNTGPATAPGSWVADSHPGAPDHDFINSGGALTFSMARGGTRVYQLDSTGKSYQKYILYNHDFSFDVDLSKIPCGYNFAVYFVDISQGNAANGEGYCDANNVGKYNCNEMDIIEANVEWNQFTSHTCNGSSCDGGGSVAHVQWSNKGIDTKQKFKVITSFKQNSMTQHYQQGGKSTPMVTLTDNKQNGGFPTMFKSMQKGMVLVISLWGSGQGSMGWLDQNCNTLSSLPRNQIEAIISNINVA